MPSVKIDSKCFTLTTKVDAFLSLGSAGKTPPVPHDFWKELSQNPETVSSFIVCLIAKLISLDSDHGLKPLPEVYRDLVEMSVDHSKYRHWAAKPLPSNAKSLAGDMQKNIVMTIWFLKECYGYVPTIHLRHLYLRWNLARNYSNSTQKKANSFEESVISSFSVAQSRQLMHSPARPLTTASTPSERDDQKLLYSLVEECCHGHRRAHFGALPPDNCRLCGFNNPTDCLSYVRLKELISSSPALLHLAMQQVLGILRNEVSHSADPGEREVLLPLLHLFREFLVMMSPIDVVDVYQTMMEYYTWPLVHSEYTQRVLDLILLEGKIKGTTFRRKLFVEHDMGIRPSTTKIRSQLVHLLVDTSHPLSRGSLLHEVVGQQERTDQHALHRLLLRNAFRSLHSSFDLVELEGKLQHLSSEALKGFALRAVESLEQAVLMGTDKDIDKFVRTELDAIHKEILQYADSDEQRDSAVSCTSMDGDLPLSDDALSSFPLRSPPLPSHALANCQYPTVLAKLRDILVKTQRQKLSEPLLPGLPERSPNSSPRRITERITEKITTERVTEKITGEITTEEKEITEKITEVAESERENGGLDSENVAGPVRTFSNSSRTSIDSGNIEPDSSPDSKPDGGSPNSKLETPSIPNGDAAHLVNGVGDHMTSHDPAVRRTTSEVTEDVETALLRPAHLTVADTSSLVERASQDSTSSKPHSNSSGTSEEGVSESRSLSHSSPRLMARRQTAPVIQRPRSGSSLGTSPLATPPSVRRYANVAQHHPSRTMSISGGGNSMRVKTRVNHASLSIKKRRMRKNSVNVTSPIHKPNFKLLKIVLAGNDLLVSHCARAYAYLKSEEPNIFGGIELRFYHVPLSRATADGQVPDPSSGSELPEPILEQVDLSGNDVHIGRFLAHMDSWYDRNVFKTVHHALRLLPCIDSSSSSSSPEGSQRPTSPLATEGDVTHPPKTALTPSKFLLDAISNYIREASHSVHIKMFRVKMMLKSEKSNKIEHREMFMLHRLDIQRLSGKKASKQLKPFEANVTMTELSLDASLVRSDMMEMKDVWLIRASNIPRAGDLGVPNPETESFELTIVKAQTEGGRFSSTKYRPEEESEFHVCDLVLETRDKPLTVMVDGDTDVLVENVIRLEVTPAYLDKSQPMSTLVGGRRNDHRLERQLHFPLMTFWPIDPYI